MIYCIKHGGGARCQVSDCPSSALPDGQGGKAIYCIKHGGGARCQDPSKIALRVFAFFSFFSEILLRKTFTVMAKGGRRSTERSMVEASGGRIQTM